MIIFGSIYIYLKNNQINFFKKKPKPNETGSNRPISVRFSYFRIIIETKPTCFGSVRFSSVCFNYFILKTKNYIVFWVFDFGLTRFFLFGSIFFCLVFFINLCSVFQFQTQETKTKPNQTEPVSFLKYYNQFNRFFVTFFIFLFSRFN